MDIPEEVLAVLLKDRSTGRNLIWATDDYEERGKGFCADDEIRIEQIVDKNNPVIRPRVDKSAEEQRQRMVKRAEVFTPSRTEECPGCRKKDNSRHTGTYCKIMDWDSGEPVEFRMIANKCSWNEGVEFGRPFLDTDKFEGNLFELMRQGVDFVMSHIAQSRGLRTESFQAPMHFELPREVVEEALVNALVHRDWRLSASVEVRLFADRVEIWNPGALPEGITIPKLYETHSSYPVNELVLKVFDFAGVIESLGTGIKRMIETCRKEGLPDPTWEQNGSSFIVTIWKDMWTEARLRELGLSERQKEAVRWLKVNRHIAASDYMSLTHVARNTATRDLNKLVAFGVLVAEGSGKYSVYSLNRLCTINAPYAPSSVKEAGNGALTAKKRRNKAGNGRLNEGIKGHRAANDGINEGLNDGINEGIKFDVFRLVLEKPGCRVPFLTKALSVSRATVERAVAALIIIGKIAHRGSKKTGGYYVVSGKGSDDGLV